jgi:methyl-accepting chemotaxis protein
MRQTGNRTITVDKKELIDIIKENKKTHIKGYKEAVSAYKGKATEEITKLVEELRKGTKDALKELGEHQAKVDDGSIDASFSISLPSVYLSLVTPINNSDNYDKIIRMFEMEVADKVELSQQEFNEYVHDETQFALEAMVSNSTYLV